MSDRWPSEYETFIPNCPHCDDHGCDRCCDTAPATLEDFEREQQEEEMAAERAREERRQFENIEMTEHYRRHPNG